MTNSVFVQFLFQIDRGIFFFQFEFVRLKINWIDLIGVRLAARDRYLTFQFLGFKRKRWVFLTIERRPPLPHSTRDTDTPLSPSLSFFLSFYVSFSLSFSLSLTCSEVSAERNY